MIAKYEFVSINTMIKLTIHHLFKGINSSKKLSEYVIRIPINKYQIISQIFLMNLGDKLQKMISLINNKTLPKHKIGKAKYSIKVFKALKILLVSMTMTTLPMTISSICSVYSLPSILIVHSSFLF